MTAADHYQPHRFTHDLWAGLGHVIGGGTGDPGRDRPDGSPNWVDTHDARRLAAYRVLAGILDNSRRYWLPPSAWNREEVTFTSRGVMKLPLAPAERHREYGDADMLIDTIRSLVLGETQDWAVPASEDPDRDSAVEWLSDWSIREAAWTKIHAGERDSIGLGDAVYAVGWSPSAGRPRLRAYDPGMFFPDWSAVDSPGYQRSGWDDDDFPPIVHLAWDRQITSEVTVLHRETYRLIPDTWTTPWGTTARWRCWKSVDEWRHDRLKTGDTVYGLPLPGESRHGGDVVLPPTDLRVDFIPVVHVPNDSSYVQHRFGRAATLRVAQILDDLQTADTDLAESVLLVGSPTLVTKAPAIPSVAPGPGSRLGLDIDGDAEILDNSRSLDALIKHGDRLLERLFTNSRVSQSIIGMVTPDQVPSGVALKLGFAATEALVREIRRVRQHKLPKIPRMALRLAVANGRPGFTAVPDVTVDFGPALPVDRAAAVAEVGDLIKSGAIAVETAVRILRAAGVPIEDVDAELAAIAGDNAADRAASAVDAVTALGEAEGIIVARRFLALDEPGSPGPPRQPTIADQQ